MNRFLRHRASSSSSCLVVLALASCNAVDAPSDAGGLGGLGGSDASGGTTSGGSGGLPSSGGAPTLDGPIARGEELVLEFGSIRFVVEPEAGGRVASFRYGADELLVADDVHPLNWGSTLWTSPQSDWGWPPPSGIDDAPFTPSLDETSFRLVGTESSFADKTLVLEKEFVADFEDEAVALTYSVTNTGDAPFSLALWEVTRVASGGLTFFPTGESAFTPDGSNSLPTQIVDGVTWFDGAQNPPNDEQRKSNADGREGWIGHVAGDLLFVKTFDDVPLATQAPGEGEVEIFTQNAAEGGYVELENQSVYVELEPAETLTYRVRWFVRKLPTTITAEVGSTELLEFVRALVE